MKTSLRLKIAGAALMLSAGLFAQSSLNVTLSDQLPMASGHTLANICGYTVGANEYALLGDEDGMIIVDVTNPANVVQIVQIPMVNSLWKEIKVYQHYAYVTTEGSGGALQIVDLNAIPATSASSYSYHTYTGDGAINGQLSTVHALHIDTTKGFATSSEQTSGHRAQFSSTLTLIHTILHTQAGTMPMVTYMMGMWITTRCMQDTFTRDNLQL